VKTRSIITAALVVVLVVLGIAQLRSCKLDKKYRDLKAEYETDRKVFEADHALSMGRIDELTNAIGQADETIVKKDAELLSKTKQLAQLSNQLDELVDNEPPTTPDIEAMPIIINLRGQLSKLTEMYIISGQTITLQSEEIAVLKGKCNTLESIGTEWKQSYDKEHALRVNCESLLKLSEKRVSNPWKTVRNVAVGVAAGFVVGSLLKK
jgi:hypothetical protein